MWIQNYSKLRTNHYEYVWISHIVLVFPLLTLNKWILAWKLLGLFKPSVPNAIFLYPWKYQKTVMFYVFRWYRNGVLGTNGLMWHDVIFIKFFKKLPSTNFFTWYIFWYFILFTTNHLVTRASPQMYLIKQFSLSKNSHFDRNWELLFYPVDTLP